jgi:dethiobiotin synthetase
MSAFFISGTGTGIGKTFVTAGLLRHLRGSGRAVMGLKPIVSGYHGAAGSDPAMLLEALGETVGEDAVARIAPWRFCAPLSPDMAAMREDRQIDFGELLAFCRDRAAGAETVLIEGVGGVMVPLDAQHTVLDWIVALGFPVVLVAGSYLGSLSHTLTAAAALERAGVPAISIIVNDSGTDDVPLTDTAATLRRFLPRHEIAIVPRNATALDFTSLAALVFHKRNGSEN